jgi:hypothetical protein
MKKEKKKRLSRHDTYLSAIAMWAEELGYKVEHIAIPEEKEKVDLILRNPKNNRKAYVEIEVTYQQQKQHTDKIKRRWELIQQDRNKGEDSVFLWIGVKKRDLISQAIRAKIENPENEYGKTLFSCLSYSDQNEVRIALLRCLGDE